MQGIVGTGASCWECEAELIKDHYQAFAQVALQQKLFAEARARTSGLVTSAEAGAPAAVTAAQAEA